jgi:cytidine diphosphoramidate kinase
VSTEDACRDVFEPGRVYWITGLAGAGKTSVGKALFKLVRAENPASVMLDGDVLREVFGSVHGYAPEERKRLAFSYGRLCRMLAEQGITVICATISMFDEVREWNRRCIPGYIEIFIDTPMEVLERRDQKGLYSRTVQGSEVDVGDVAACLEMPSNPDLVLPSDGSTTPDLLAERIMLKFGLGPRLQDGR